MTLSGPAVTVPAVDTVAVPAVPPAGEVLARYRDASKLVRDKVIHHLDDHCTAFIRLSPFATLATASPDGWPEVSPRGGDPGFVKVPDAHTLVLPDRTGNNRVDSLKNLAANPRAALMFLVPGIDESLRVYGTTALLPADALDLDLTEFGRAPQSVLVLTVEKAYFQCSKAVMRSGLWDPESRIERSLFPPFSQVLKDHCRTHDIPDEDVLRAGLRQEL
jgi:PPOX class probable FMN-dependent enzyme